MQGFIFFSLKGGASMAHETPNIVEVYSAEAAAERLGITEKQIRQELESLFYPDIVLKGYEQAREAGKLKEWLDRRKKERKRKKKLPIRRRRK